MTRLMDEVIGHLSGDAQVDASTLGLRIDALARFRRVAAAYLPLDWLAPAQAVADRASGRLGLSRTHTVVGIAGPTGSGKSSMFNALAGMELSPVGVRRPTTGSAHACVWGAPAEAAAVLDWIGVARPQRFARADPPPSAAGTGPGSSGSDDDQTRLRGLILLDLPDFDSVERDHAAEVARLLEFADLVLWVVDPQKYADQSLHEHQLRPLRRHRDVMLVALNQSDLLDPGQTGQVLADLRRLLALDGLADIPTVATSTVAPGGLAELRVLLQRAVSSKRAALRRLAADLDEVVAGLSDLAGPDLPGHVAPDRELVDGLAAAAGLPAATEVAAWAYRRRAAAAMAWPVPRPQPAAPVLAPPHQATQRAAVSLAARAFAERASDRLPPPWPAAVTDASRSRLDEVPAALAAAVALTIDADQLRTPIWWRLVGAGQWLAAGVAALGVCWVLAAWLLRAVDLPVTQPQSGLRVLLAGAVIGGALALLARPLARWAAWHAQTRLAGELREAVAEVGRGYVVAPVQQVRQAYAEARAALRAAGPR